MKTRPSKLDAHAEQLREWDAQNVPLGEMATRLKSAGCSVSLGRLSQFLADQRQAALQSRLLAQITTGSRACKEVEAQFAKTDAPELASLIKLHRVLIMQLATQASADPALIELVTGAMKPVLEFAKLELKGREFGLERDKWATQTCELFLKWFADQKARDIAESNASNADKIAQLRQTYFADVDALEKSGSVKLPA